MGGLMRTHTLSFIVRPSDDVPGDWGAHCLEFDVFGQGETSGEALELAIESAEIHIRESLREGRDPNRTAGTSALPWVYCARSDDGSWMVTESHSTDVRGVVYWVAEERQTQHRVEGRTRDLARDLGRSCSTVEIVWLDPPPSTRL